MYEKISRFMLVSFNLSLRVSSPFKEWRKVFLRSRESCRRIKYILDNFYLLISLFEGELKRHFRLAFDVNIILNLSKGRERGFGRAKS